MARFIRWVAEPFTVFGIGALLNLILSAAAYAGGFQRLITDWRAQFGQPQLPFFFVQLASFLPLQNNRPGHGGAPGAAR